MFVQRQQKAIICLRVLASTDGLLGSLLYLRKKNRRFFLLEFSSCILQFIIGGYDRRLRKSSRCLEMIRQERKGLKESSTYGKNYRNRKLIEKHKKASYYSSNFSVQRSQFAINKFEGSLKSIHSSIFVLPEFMLCDHFHILFPDFKARVSKDI